MNCLHGIKVNSDLAALKGAQVSYSKKLGQLFLNGEPLVWVFANRTEAVAFARKHGATVGV